MTDGKPGLLGEDPSLPEEIFRLHSQYPLSCAQYTSGGLLCLDKALLAYLLALMRGERPRSPTRPEEAWDRLLTCLRPHWIDPWVYRLIMETPRGSRPPDNVVEALKETYTSSVVGTLTADRQLAGIAGEFGQQGIEFLVLKGAALAKTVYPDPFLRPGSDLDILVRPGDVRRARKALEAAGYRCEYPFYEVSEKLFCEEQFRYRDRKADYRFLELHWSLSQYTIFNRSLDLEDYFERAATAKAGTQEVLVMDLADATIYASVHLLLQHFDSVRLSWINDLGLLGRAMEGTEGWEQLRARASESGTGPLLRPALRMAELWTGLNVPQELYQPDPDRERKVSEAFEAVKRRKSGDADEMMAIWPAGASLREKCRIVRFLAMPPEKIMRAGYFPGENLSLPVMHLKRWGQIIGRNLLR